MTITSTNLRSIALALIGLGATGVLIGCSRPAEDQARAQEVNVYSGRHYNTDKELYADFTRRTGIKVNVIEGKDDELIERLRREGDTSPADVLVVVDAARIHRAQEMDLFQPTSSPDLENDVPADLRDPQGRWFALTRRARPVMVNTASVDPSLIGSYDDLTREELRGKLCLRNSASVYNQSLTADVLVREGAAATESWLQGMIANVEQPFFTSDTPMIRAVATGQCGAAVANQYYLGRLLNSDNPADREAAEKVTVVWPDPTHINVTAAGVTRSAGNPEGGRMLLEFLASPTAGEGFASANYEYPLKGFGDNATLEGLGTFNASTTTIAELGNRNQEAVQLMQQANWD
ncbi:MAG: extracellular solute-binding protein [Cyanobacteria bacterium J06638_7]